MAKEGKLISGSVHFTKTAAGHFAKGYRSKRFGGVGKPKGTVKVMPVGRYWGVFDYDPQPLIRYISISQGIEEGDTYRRRIGTRSNGIRITPKRPRISR